MVAMPSRDDAYIKMHTAQCTYVEASPHEIDGRCTVNGLNLLCMPNDVFGGQPLRFKT